MATVGSVRQYLTIYDLESDPEWEEEELAVAQLRIQNDVSYW